MLTLVFSDLADSTALRARLDPPTATDPLLAALRAWQAAAPGVPRPWQLAFGAKPFFASVSSTVS